MTAQPKKRHPWKFERRDREPMSRRRPELDNPSTAAPIPSGVRPDLAEPGEDGNGVAGGVGKSI